MRGLIAVILLYFSIGFILGVTTGGLVEEGFSKEESLKKVVTRLIYGHISYAKEGLVNRW